MIIFLFGPDGYRRSQRVRTLQRAFEDKFDSAGHSVERISGDDFDINTFTKAIASGGLFSEKRFVVLTELWSLNKESQTQLKETLDRVGEDVILCISADTPPRKDNALYKHLLTSDTIEEYGDLNHSQLRSFIVQECTQRGATIENEALALLIARVGNDLWRMSNTINAIAHYSTTITAADVELFVDGSLNDNIFDLTDALGMRQSARALQLLDEQFLLGSNAQYLLTMLGKHITNVLLVKLSGGEELPLHPFVVQKATAQGKHFSTEQLQALHDQLLDIDVQLKSTGVDARVLLGQFIVNACT